MAQSIDLVEMSQCSDVRMGIAIAGRQTTRSASLLFSAGAAVLA